MRRLLLALAALICPSLTLAQGGTTTVTATVKDPNGALYTSSQVNITFIDPPTDTSGKLPLLNGSTFQQQYTIFATDSFAKFSQVLPDNGVIDSSSGTNGTEWSFRIIYSDRATSFVYVTPIRCSTNFPAPCVNGVMDISAQLQAVAALLPAQPGGGGAFVVKSPPCASAMGLLIAGSAPTSANTVFNIPLNCNVTSSTVSQSGGGPIQTGTKIVVTLTNSGGFSFAWPANFIDQPPIQSTGTTNSAFWYDGTNWHADTFPATGGGGSSPVGPQGTVQSTNGTVFSASNISEPPSGPLAGALKVNEDLGTCGPNPNIDIRCFGARASNPNVAPSAVGITANCVASQNQVSISSASTFVKGDGVILYGCGPPHTMTTPVIASVTPSVALAGTGALHTTPGPTGATTYNYKLIVRDRNGGLTAASPVVSTTTGAATLGARTVNITSMARSSRTVTVTTAAAHGFLIGCSTLTCGEVYIGNQNSLSDSSFDGWFTVTSAVDSTHFTFISGLDATLGATTSATGGTATYYNNNLVCASSLPSNAIEFYLLSDRASLGTYAVVAAGYPNFVGNTIDLCIEDYGSPMMDNQVFPPFVTAAAPWATATSDHLSTTITGGAGTTTLTLASPAGTIVNGATIRLDSVPGINAAIASRGVGGGTINFPVDPSGNSFVINSWLNVASGVPFSQTGNIYLNDTFEITSVGSAGNSYIGNITPQSGGISVGGWGSYPTVSINSAHPGFWFSNSSQFGLHVSGLNLNAVPSNGTVEMVAEGGFNQTFDHINFNSGSGFNDYMSMGLRLKGSGGQNNSNVLIDFVTFAPGGGGDGASHTPTLWASSASTFIPHSYSLHRGMLYDGGNSISLADGGVAYINGGGTPLLTLFNSFASVKVNGPIILDTIAHPCIAALTSGTSLSIINFVLPPTVTTTCQPSSGVFGVSGNYGALLGFNIPIMANTISPSIANLGSFNYVAEQQLNGHLNVDPNHSAFIRATQMAQPTCSVSAGGSLAVGSYQFQVAPIWNGFAAYDPPSAPSSVCTATTGNQTITINWSTAPGNPLGYAVYEFSAINGNGLLQRQTSGAGSACGPPFLPLGTTSWVLNTALVNCGVVTSSIQTGGPTALLPGVQGMITPAFTITGGGFLNTFSFSGTANRTTTFPDASGTVAISASSPVTLSAAGAVACPTCFDKSASNNIGANFYDIGTRAGPGNPAAGNIRVYADSTSGNLTCLTSAGANCIPGGGAGTPGGSNTQVQFNASGAFGASPNMTFTSPALSLGSAAGATGQVKYVGTTSGTVTTQSQDAAGTWTFKWPTSGGTSGFPLTTDGTGISTWSLLGFAGGGTNQTTFTANQLVTDTSGSLASLAGTTTGTNPILKLQPSAAANTALILDTAATPTGDVQDWNINGTKTSWMDNAAFLHTPQTTYTGTGPLTLAGTEGTCGSVLAATDIICLGDSSTHMAQLSNNGLNLKPIAQLQTAGPPAHQVALAFTTAPQISFTTGGALGNSLLNQGASADPLWGPINLGGGAGFITGTLPVGNGGTGSTTLSGANIVTVTGAITVGHCAQWNASTIVTDSGGTCGGAGSNPPLNTITAATAANTPIANSTFAQRWNWALTGSTTGFIFGESAASTGANNILLQATTANTSTAVPFQTDNNGNGYQLSSSGLWKPVGTGTVAIPGTAHGLVVGETGTTAVSVLNPGTVGQIPISQGPGADPVFGDPVVSQAFVNLWTAQDITATRTSANVRNPIFSQTATIQLTFAGITGSPATCTLQFRGVDSQGNVLNNGGTVAITPANGTTSQTFNPASTLLVAAQVSAVYACVTYPTAGTLTLDFTPIQTVTVSNFPATQPVSGTVTANAGTGTFNIQANASVNQNQVAGSAIATAATGIAKVGLTGNTGAAMDAAGQNVTAPANELLTGCQFNTTPTTITSGNMSPSQCDNGGKLLVNVGTPAVTQSGNWTTRMVGNAGAIVDQAPGSAVPANVVMEGLSDGTNSRRALSDTTGRQFMLNYPDTTTASYHTSKKYTLSSTTDIVVMPGNATNTVLVTKIVLTCTQTTAGTINVELIKRSTADTGGTSASMTAVPDDSNYVAAVSAPLTYTGTGPTVGTAVGDLDNAQVGCPATSVSGPNDIYVFPLGSNPKPIVLRGTAQQIAINLGGAVTGGTGTVTIYWDETTTP